MVSVQEITIDAKGPRFWNITPGCPNCLKAAQHVLSVERVSFIKH